jgi:hypothetical protein
MRTNFIIDLYQELMSRLKNIREQKLRGNCQLFCERVLIQSEEDFIDNCFDRVSLDKKKIGIVIRKAIAQLGMVDVNYIRSDLSFGDLYLLPIWDLDIFQTPLLVNIIESQLNIYFTDKELELAKVRNPDTNPEMKIHEFINEFYDWYSLLPSRRQTVD